MKKIITLLFIVTLSQLAYGQASALEAFNKQKNHTGKTGFIVLGSWGAANMIYAGIGTSGAHGSNKYFNQMNIMWGAVNLGLGVMGYLGSKREGALSYEQSLKKQIKLEKTFLLNAGLDVAYIASGLYLKERSKNVIRNSDKFKGYGESVLFQGGGLLVFDVIMYSLHNAHGKSYTNLQTRYN